MRSLGYLLAFFLILVVAGILVVWIGVLAYALAVFACTLCVGMWIAG